MTVGTASAIGLFLTRRGELTSGINVKTPGGQELGCSPAAAEIAVR
jgi:hypothetical protein